MSWVSSLLNTVGKAASGSGIPVVATVGKGLDLAIKDKSAASNTTVASVATKIFSPPVTPAAPDWYAQQNLQTVGNAPPSRIESQAPANALSVTPVVLALAGVIGFLLLKKNKS